MMRSVLGVLLFVTSGCALDSAPTAAPDAATPPPPARSATVLVSWSGQDVISANPEDSRVPRTLTGPPRPCPSVVGDNVVQVDLQVVIGTADAFVGDATLDCAVGHTSMAVPAGTGTFRLDVVTAEGYAWLAAYGPITTTSEQPVDEIADLNNEIPTSGGGGDDDGGGGLGGYF